MLPRIPTPGARRPKTYVEKFSDSRKLKSTRKRCNPTFETTRLHPSEEPIKFGLNEPAPSPHCTGLSFVLAVIALGILVSLFLLWMQAW